MTTAPEGVDLDALSAWMDAEALPRGPIEDLELLGGGTQNIMLRFARGGRVFVLRRPPLHKRKNSDATMGREARVLRALAGTDVPHPGFVAGCDDVDVLGAAFYLMQPVEGFNPAQGLPTLHAESDAIRREMADGIARLGEVDYLAVGLEGLGKPDGYLERQVSRWLGQLESYAGFEGYPGHGLEGVDAVAQWLAANLPADYRPGILHGDYHIANVMFRNDGPELAAIVDWELTTIGDPLLDLGALLAFSPGDGAAVSLLPAWPGYPGRAELLARYAETSTRKLDAVAWYEVLACFRLGIILEGTRARAFAGQAPMETADYLRERTVELLAKARALVRDPA